MKPPFIFGISLAFFFLCLMRRTPVVEADHFDDLPILAPYFRTSLSAAPASL